MNLQIQITGGGGNHNLDSKNLKDIESKKHILDSIKHLQHGKDMLGKFARNYDLPLAFPNIKFEIATKDEIKYYKKHYSRIYPKPFDPFKYTPPAYFGMYYSSLAVFEFQQYFKENFEPIDKDTINPLVSEILETNSCAVHIRRGDVSEYSMYGYPPNKHYFLNAINLVNKLDSNVKFYFFSDEPQFIKDNIAPDLINIDYRICEQNGSDKGYLDLYAISRAKHIISSHGSLGIYGKLLSIRKDKPNYFVLSRFTQTYFELYKEDCILLGNNSFYTKPPQTNKISNKKVRKLRFIDILRLKLYNYFQEKLHKRGVV